MLYPLGRKDCAMVFDNRKVRRVLHDGEWYFAVVDVAAALTGGVNPGDDWRSLKEQELEGSGVDLSALCRRLEVEDVSGRKCQEEAATLEGIFRIVQSVSSPKAEVFKRWLARIGHERKDRQDHKTDLDSIFSMLGEAATDAIACRHNVREPADYEIAARMGRRIAEEAHERLKMEIRGTITA